MEEGCDSTVSNGPSFVMEGDRGKGDRIRVGRVIGEVGRTGGRGRGRWCGQVGRACVIGCGRCCARTRYVDAETIEPGCMFFYVIR